MQERSPQERDRVPVGFCALRHRLLPAGAGGVHRDFGAGQGLVELLFDQQRFHRLAAPGQACVQAV